MYCTLKVHSTMAENCFQLQVLQCSNSNINTTSTAFVNSIVEVQGGADFALGMRKGNLLKKKKNCPYV